VKVPAHPGISKIVAGEGGGDCRQDEKNKKMEITRGSLSGRQEKLTPKKPDLRRKTRKGRRRISQIIINRGEPEESYPQLRERKEQNIGVAMIVRQGRPQKKIIPGAGQ